MATFEFKLPDIGEGVVEGEIVKWLVKPGDAVAEDQPLVEVMTDKATVTIPSPKSGRVVKTHGNEGDMARVHHPLVTLELDGGAASSASSQPVTDAAGRSSGPAAQVSTAAPGGNAPSRAGAATNGSGARVLATPVTRRIAREHGLNLSDISGTGPQGRVTKADVLAVIAGEGAVATGNQVAQSAAAPAARSQPAPVVPLPRAQGDQRIPLRGLRKRIAEKMVRSKFTAPHFTFVEEMDASQLVALRKRINETLAASGDTTKVTFLPFIVKAVIAALRQFPALNANMDEATQEHVIRGEYNIGIAAATEEGLTVPVVRHADRLSIRELAVEIARLGAAAREKKLKPEELSGGTFTITSLGQTGGLFATPIINHPEVGILGVHKMRKRPVVDDSGAIVVHDMMYLSLSFDHRVIDGQVGAEFTYAIIRYLETPEMLFLEMT
ncbi:MAG: 2-oxo acid dehydrogenase subunit E2 [Myxococcaceae bacterium]|nr:2-oxo acid dehydrogenase subunit E2 [Myxococcaceae bacterium]